MDRREVAWTQEGLEAVLALGVEIDEGKAGGNECPTLAIAEDQLHGRVAQDEVDGVPRELVVDGDGDETRAHGPEVGDEELGAVRGKNGHRVAPTEAAGEEPSRAGVGELVNLAVGVFARVLPVEAIYHRRAVGGTGPVEEVTQIVAEARHDRSPTIHRLRRRPVRT